MGPRLIYRAASESGSSRTASGGAPRRNSKAVPMPPAITTTATMTQRWFLRSLIQVRFDNTGSLASHAKLPKLLLDAGVVATHVKLMQQPFNRGSQRAFDGAAAGALVTSAAKCLGHGSHVHRAFAAQAHTEATVGLLAEKQRDLNAFDGKRVIYQAFTVFFAGMTTLHGSTVHVHPCQRAVLLQAVQGCAQQPHLGKLGREVNVVGHADGI